MNCERQIELTPKEAQTIIKAFNVWEGQEMPQPIWAIVESIHNKIESIAEQEEDDEDERVVVLNDGETYTGLKGSKILTIPTDIDENDVDTYVKDNYKDGVDIQ